jgi:hypothetical protein
MVSQFVIVKLGMMSTEEQRFCKATTLGAVASSGFVATSSRLGIAKMKNFDRRAQFSQELSISGSLQFDCLRESRKETHRDWG